MDEAAGDGIKQRRIALLLEYDGVPFNGWQIQNEGHTIQDDLQKSLKTLTGENISLTASGRTDAGVHALGQVAHFDTSSDLDLFRMVRSINGISHPSVSVKNAYHVPDDFHARFDACEREYIYKIYNFPQKSPFIVNRALWFPSPFDIDLANKAAGFLTGTHDFKSFCKKISHDINTIRTINYLCFEKHEDYIYMTIRAESFIHNMVRIIAGTICEIVRKKDSPETILEVLNERKREAGGVTAPPFALYFNRITYNPELEKYEKAYSLF